MSRPLSNFIFYLLSFISYLLSLIFYLLSLISYLLSFISYLLSFISYLLSFIFLLVLGRGTVLVLGLVAVKQGEDEADDGEDYRGNDRNPYCN